MHNIKNDQVCTLFVKDHVVYRITIRHHPCQSTVDYGNMERHSMHFTNRRRLVQFPYNVCTVHLNNRIVSIDNDLQCLHWLASIGSRLQSLLPYQAHQTVSISHNSMEWLRYRSSSSSKIRLLNSDPSVTRIDEFMHSYDQGEITISNNLP